MRILLTAASLLAIILTTASSFAETLVLGSVNDNVRKHIARYTPMARYLERELADQGITSVKIRVLANSEEMIEALSRGEVDLYFDSPLVAAKVAQRSGAIPFLRRWKQGVSEYHSVIVVLKDSPIKELSDLPGRRIGFQEPDSTSGFLLPAGMLRRAGIRLKQLTDRSEMPSADTLGYLFTGDDENTVLWLARGWIDAGATDPRGFKILQKARPGQYRELAHSITVPRQVIIRYGNMPDALVQALSETFSSMHESDEGKAVMKKFHKTTRFDAFPLGVADTFEPIYELLEELKLLGII